MKKIGIKSAAVFLAMWGASALFAGIICYFALSVGLHLSLAHELSYAVVFAISYLGFCILALRGWLKLYPTPKGEVLEKDIWHVHTYLLFYSVVFNPIIKSFLLPVPLLRAFYLALGARMADNSYTGGVIYDAHLVTIGANCLMGEGSLLTPHQMERHRLGYFPIVIGNNVTVGAHAVILPGVTIEDDAMIASGSVVPKGTLIQKGEVWGGVPAKLLKTSRSEELPT